MDNNIKRQIEMFLRVREFGIANPSDFPAESFAGRLFTQLNDIYADAWISAVGQASKSPRAASARKERARTALRDDIVAIARTAQTIDLRRPELSLTFLPPKKPTDQNLLATAKAFAQNAEAFHDEFIQRGLPENFLDDLESDIATFEQAISGKISTIQAASTALRSLRNATARGMETVRKLDPIVRNVYRGNPDKLEAWKQARTVERVARASSRTSEPAEEPEVNTPQAA